MWPGKGKSGAPCLSCSPRDPTPDKRMTMRMRMRMRIIFYVKHFDISDSSEDVSAGSGPERGLQMEVGNMDEHGGNTCDSELLQHMNAQQEEYDGAEQYIAGDGHEHGQPGFRQSRLLRADILEAVREEPGLPSLNRTLDSEEPEEPEDTSLDRRERRKRRFAGRAKKKAKSRRRGSRQRVTMVTISEPDPGHSEDPEDTSLDREETRKRRFALWFHITVIVSIGLLSILLISLRFSESKSYPPE
ncbi:unnamed protein product [Arctogadus glacialis]